MAFTKVLGPGIHTLSNITSHNIHSSGIITATGFDGPFTNLNVTGVTTFSGDVSIGGTLTYEDVKNIDSIGIVTAREGVHIPDNKRLDFGGTAGNGDFEIRHTSGNTFIENNTGQFFISQGTAAASSPLTIHGGSELQLKHYYGNGGQLFALKSVRGYQTEIYWQGQKKIETTSKGILVGTGVTIETNGQANFVGVTTFGNVVGGASTSVVVNRDLVLRDAWGYANHVKFHYGNNTLNFPSASLSNIARLPKLSFGDRTSTSQLGVGDFLMYHDFYNMHMRYFGANGNLVFSNKNTEIHIQGSNGSGNPQQSIRIKSGATEGVILYHGGNAKFETAGIGASVYGTLVATGADINGDLDVDGHTNLDNVSVAGVSTITGISNHSSRIQMLAGNAVRFLNAANSASTEIKCDGGARLNITSYNQTMATFENGQSTIFYTNSGQNRLQITNAGNVLIAQDLDVDGHTNLDNVSIVGVATVTGSNINIEGGSASLSQLKINSTGRYRGIQLDENGTRKAHFQHDATSNNLVVGTAEGTMQFNSGDTPRVILNSSGHWVPYVDSTYDLGLTGTRWRNVYADTLYGDGSNLTGISAGTSLSGSTNNTVCTVTGANAIQGEANLTFDGSRLDVLGNTDGNVQASFTRANDSNFRIQFRNESSGNGVGDSQGKFGLFYNSNSADICGMQFLRGASTGAGTLMFTTGGTERLRITSDGKFSLGSSNSSPAAAVHIDYDSNNLLMLDNSTASTQKIFFAQNASTHAQIYATSNTGALTIESDPSNNHSNSFIDFRIDGGEKLRIESSGQIKMSNDSARIRMGASHEFELYHNGTYSYVSDNRSGGSDELRIAGRAVRILNQDSSSTTGYFSYNAAKLYYTNYEKLSTVTSGVNITGTVKASSPTSHRNYFINGACTIWQRATDSNNHSSIYTCDRWWRANNASRVQRSTTTPTGTGNGVVTHPFPFSMHVTSNGSNASIGQAIELTQTGVSQFKHSTSYTLSMYVRTASGTSDINAYVYYRNSKFSTTNQTNWSGSAGNNTYWNMGTATTTWQRFEKTFTSPANPNANNQVLAVEFNLSTSFYVTGLQFEEGQVATPFEYRDNAEEMKRCQRYFSVYHLGTQEWLYFEGATSNHKWWQCPIPAGMRSEPSITKGGTCSTLNLSAAGGGTINSFGVTSIDNGGSGGTTHQGAMGRVSVRVGFTGNIGGSYEIRHTDGWGGGAGWLEFDSEM